ncbi:MAG: DHH family phosphoesterase [Patescibacteria group bacterium]
MGSTNWLNKNKKWEVLHRRPITNHGTQSIIDILLKNRGIKTKNEKDEFFKPTPPEKISLKKLGIKTTEVNKAIKRLSDARKKKEKVIVFGDYDADGICATAILWECLYGLGLDVLPYIPERFSEGYGLKEESVETLREKYKNLGLIITVDNGIVANEAVEAANKLGIDVIITDHHLPRTNTPRERKRHSGIPHVVSHSSRRKANSVRGQEDYPKAHSIIHTTEIGGAGIAWIFAREILKKLEIGNWKLEIRKGLGLCAIGTISDQLPLVGPNRSFAKYGLEVLNKTDRVGLHALFREARIKPGNIGTYEVNFVIAPRINAMGRLEHAIESLRLLCTKSEDRAIDLSYLLGKTNTKRRKIVEDVVAHATRSVEKLAAGQEGNGVIVLCHESYHEGVIGLAASRLVERFYRPAIVISRGKTHSKASARSISGFNIIETLRKLDDMMIDGGGHPMAAGFTVENSVLKKFIEKLDKISKPLLTDDILTKKLKVDLGLNFRSLNLKLAEAVKKFEPTGIGNPTPSFITQNVTILNARTVGIGGKHLKLTLEHNDKVFDAIAFGFGDLYIKLQPETSMDVVYRLEENIWNGKKNLELKIKDIKLNH